MESSLSRDRQAFIKRALANPSIENRKRQDTKSDEPPKKKARTQGEPKSYKSTAPGSQLKFGVLAKIVRHMKTRHQDGDTHALSIDEVLDETNQLNVSPRIKQWLITEALPENPKILETDGKYIFQPPLNVRDKKSLLKLLRQHDMKGHGGIMIDDIQESVPHFDKVMKNINEEILRINRQTDKKQIIFYHDRSIQFDIDKEFIQLWRNTSVDGLQDDNIDEYLTKQGIKSMQDSATKSMIPIRKKVKSRKPRQVKIGTNEHVQSVLKNYDDI